MRKNLTIPLVALGLFLFFWVNVPKWMADRLRSGAVAPFRFENKGGEKFQAENQILRNQLEHIYDWLAFHQKVKGDFELFAQNRVAHLKEVMAGQLYSVPAQVIYRDPSSWSSSLWVNVGEQDNGALGRVVVAKNSPVLSEGALVGVVDYVGKKQARVRLITDSGLSPAVRVARGSLQNREMAHLIQGLLNLMEKREDLAQYVSPLKELKEKCGTGGEDKYLAKGEVHGSSAPLWRSRSPMLKGIGFHFEGEAGFLKEGDLLVTSGLDGVFPMGLKVGTVYQVIPPKPGGYAYEALVRPVASRLNDLESVVVLPPIGE
jgi:cell shape-determining protein MreC